MADQLCAGIRAFISYSHFNRDAASRIAQWIQDSGGQPLWDENLPPGTRFRDRVRSFIGNAHVFVALLTDNSTTRTWVLQEIGYAAAVNAPIVPVSAGPIPDGLIGDLHALKVAPDWSNLEQKLSTVDWQALGQVQRHQPPTVMATLARSGMDRVRLMVEHAMEIQAFAPDSLLRQRAGLTSFSIPDAPVLDPIWAEFDGGNSRETDYHRLQREERQIFEKAARKFGCKLILNPRVDYPALPEKRIRLRTLRMFLDDPRSDGKIQAIPTSDKEFDGNLTIFGDWWAAESLLLRKRGFREATFIRHPWAVKRFSDGFDEEFDQLCRNRGVQPEDSRKLSIEEIDKALAQGL
jgi:hypothetical protein